MELWPLYWPPALRLTMRTYLKSKWAASFEAGWAEEGATVASSLAGFKALSVSERARSLGEDTRQMQGSDHIC